LDGFLIYETFSVGTRETSMKRFLVRVAAFLGAFIIAVAGNAVINRVYPRFENVAVGSLASPTGGRGGFSSFKSRDGVNLVFEHVDYPSRDAANEAFQKMVAGSERILEREVLYDPAGKLVTGERVVILLRDDSGVKASAVISLDDTKVYLIASTSLRHTLFFERQHRRY
jgi:hypothetical protein